MRELETCYIALGLVITSCLSTERYFQCEPMDATVSPIALTSSDQGGQAASSAVASEASSPRDTDK